MNEADQLDKLVTDHGTAADAADLARLRERAAQADRLEHQPPAEIEQEKPAGAALFSVYALGLMAGKVAPENVAFVREAEVRQAAYAATRRAATTPQLAAVRPAPAGPKAAALAPKP